jgi:hypothetical protein
MDQAKADFNNKQYANALFLFSQALGVEEAGRKDPIQICYIWNKIPMRQYKLKLLVI